jgi:TolA-binding protein
LNFAALGASHSFAMMKQAFLVMLTALLAVPAFAQADAVALAAQREQEENVKRLTATVQEVQEAQQKQQERISGLVGEVDKLRTEVAKANNNAATQDSLKRLSDQILDVDKARIADNKKVYEALAELKKLILDRPTPPPVRPQSFTPPSTANGSDTARPTPPANVSDVGFEYQVQSGDTLGHIVTAYQKQGIKVTQKQVIDANPNVNWNKLRIGQKVFIPKPK